MTPPNDQTTPALRVELEVTPQPVTPANFDEVTVGVKVTNLGPKPLDPQIGMSELTVNGVRSKDWGMALNNSGHPTTWRSLPPGETVGSRHQLAKELFPTSGDYHLELVVSGIAATPVDVKVTR